MDELTKIALVGTSKYAGSFSNSDHPAVALVSDSADNDREGSLLLACGAKSVYELAGRRSVAAIDPVAPSAPETKKAASRKLAVLLEDALSEKGNELLLDFLSQMGQRQVVLPPELLPLLLEIKDPEVRRSVIPVLGERGTWLCRQNPDWSWFETFLTDQTQAAPRDLMRTMDEGTIDERCRALESLRRLDPRGAREWVEKVFSREKHGNRVKLLKSLETGLHDGDEAFLEGCLDDRSPAVGQAAASLLCKLPQSALAGRMLTRAAAMFTFEKQGPALENVRLVCTPPKEIEPDWERDGVTRKPPAGVGLRAFWVEQVLSSVRVSQWSKRFGLDPQTLILAVADDPFAESVLAGWTKAVVRFVKHDAPSAEWLAPVWRQHAVAIGVWLADDSSEKRTESDELASTVKQLGSIVADLAELNRRASLMPMKELVTQMAPALAESCIMSLLESEAGVAVALALEMAPTLVRPWSTEFSFRFLAIVRSILQTVEDESGYQWAVALAQCACAIAPEAFPQAVGPWSRPAGDPKPTWFAAAIPRELDKFTTTIEKRQSFLKELDQ
jgi:hypothetical protein